MVDQYISKTDTLAYIWHWFIICIGWYAFLFGQCARSRTFILTESRFFRYLFSLRLFFSYLSIFILIFNLSILYKININFISAIVVHALVYNISIRHQEGLYRSTTIFFTWPAGDEAHGVRCWKTMRCASKADVRHSSTDQTQHRDAEVL